MFPPILINFFHDYMKPKGWGVYPHYIGMPIVPSTHANSTANPITLSRRSFSFVVSSLIVFIRSLVYVIIGVFEVGDGDVILYVVWCSYLYFVLSGVSEFQPRTTQPFV
jgi:hypothetical protein